MDRRPSLDRAIPGRPIAADRHPDGFYRTPRWAVEALLDREKFPGLTWEPACGDGAISKVMIERGMNVVSTDLNDWGYGRGGIDFTMSSSLDGMLCDNVVTNPPFQARLPERFLHRALQVSTGKVVLLARVLWLEGAGRGRTVFNGATPLRTVYVLSTRANVARSGYNAPAHGRGGMAAFAWYVWEHGYVGDPTLRWIS